MILKRKLYSVDKDDITSTAKIAEIGTVGGAYIGAKSGFNKSIEKAAKGQVKELRRNARANEEINKALDKFARTYKGKKEEKEALRKEVRSKLNAIENSRIKDVGKLTKIVKNNTRKTVIKSTGKKAAIGAALGTGIGIASTTAINKMAEKAKEKSFSWTYDIFFDLNNLKYCKSYPKFVFDYIKNVQSKLKGGEALCSWNFPVVSMNVDEDDSDNTNGKYFGSSVEDCGFKIPLVYKDGKWFEEKGIFFKKLNPIPNNDPAKYIYDYITNDADDYDEENKNNSDYNQWMKARAELKMMIGKYTR
jgi:hypothetical protein